MQKMKSKVESSNSEKNTLLQQLGLVASSVDGNISNDTSTGEEKSDNQAEGEKREEVDGPVDPFLPANRPQQKNKKKCWICRTKLELAQRELGNCKCGMFCFSPCVGLNA